MGHHRAFDNGSFFKNQAPSQPVLHQRDRLHQLFLEDHRRRVGEFGEKQRRALRDALREWEREIDKSIEDLTRLINEGGDAGDLARNVARQLRQEQAPAARAMSATVVQLDHTAIRQMAPQVAGGMQCFLQMMLAVVVLLRHRYKPREAQQIDSHCKKVEHAKKKLLRHFKER